MAAFNFNTAPRIVFGEGVVARIGEIAAAASWIVVDEERVIGERFTLWSPP